MRRTYIRVHGFRFRNINNNDNFPFEKTFLRGALRNRSRTPHPFLLAALFNYFNNSPDSYAAAVSDTPRSAKIRISFVAVSILTDSVQRFRSQNDVYV